MRALILKIRDWYRNTFRGQSIQKLIALSFTLITAICMLVLGLTLYSWYSNNLAKQKEQYASQLLNQTNNNIEVYLKSMRRISDTMYYSVIKDRDLAKESINSEMTLLYEVNKDNLINISLYDSTGSLVTAAPVALEKDDVDIAGQSWFTISLSQIENLHFSTPHVEHLYDDLSYQYHWVVSLSRAVELTKDGRTSLGVLLVDMNYSSIEQLFNNANDNEGEGYIYLMDKDGEIIYHPRQQMIYSGMLTEDSAVLANENDGSYIDTFNGEEEIITIKTVSYTGWKIVSVMPSGAFKLGIAEARYFLVAITVLLLLMIILLNQVVSARILKPLNMLNSSVMDWEAGNEKSEIYVGGTDEVAHLGRSLRTAFGQVHELMDEVVNEQEEKRITELDALQSQINPHFLYNTLDSIVWMIEGGSHESAVFMITELASLFRISLSKGKTIISIDDELKHVKNYMNIQKIRYKNKFETIYEIDDGILNYCTVKLILQPILENAIYYGVQGLDDAGKITVRGFFSEGDIILEVEDDGLGMREETVKGLLTGDPNVHTKGSGVGLNNVHKRIGLRFGDRYGLSIMSEPDEGTLVRIRLPKIKYTPENAAVLEAGHMVEKEAEDEI